MYAISGDTISVVSKTVHTDKKWASTTQGAVYSGNLPSNIGNNTDYPGKTLSEVLNGVKDGYTAWADIISKWNKKALFKNYQAISIALGDKKFKDYDDIATSGTSGEVQAVTSFVEGSNGESIRERWYLPNAAELELIYSRVGDLEKNKFFAEPSSPTDNNSMGPELSKKLSGRLFWSCEVAQSSDVPTPANGTTYENYAKYVSFVPSDSGTKEGNKNSTVIDVIAVANFKYSSF